MKKPVVYVTDHALVRYMERVLGVNTERLRRRIGHVVDNGVTQGASAVVADGIRYRLRRGVVVTIVPVKTRKKKRGHK